MSEMTEQQYIQAIYQFAAAQMRAKQSNKRIKQMLIEQGVDEKGAEIVIYQLSKARADEYMRAGWANIGQGILVFIGFAILMVILNIFLSQAGYMVGFAGIIIGPFRALYGIYLLIQGAIVRGGLEVLKPDIEKAKRGE